MCTVDRRQYKRQYIQPSRQQTVQRPMITDKTAMTPKLTRPGPGAAVYADDVNDYTRAGGGCAVHRPLPSLPRRIDGSWAKSVRSDASGSDASLHWDTLDDDGTGVGTGAANVDDLPPQTVHSRAARCRSVAAGPGDYGTAGRGRGVGAQTVHDVSGYRTMPRPGVQYGVLVSDDVNQQLAALQRRRQSQPSESRDTRQYVNIAPHSVDV